MIYFIQHTGDKLVKIGFTEQLEQRLHDIAKHFGGPIEILGVCEGDIAIEKYIHTRFETYRRDGEWFIPHKDIFDYVSANSRQPEISAALKLYLSLERDWRNLISPRGRSSIYVSDERARQIFELAILLWQQEDVKGLFHADKSVNLSWLFFFLVQDRLKRLVQKAAGAEFMSPLATELSLF